jgi:hypothetical protein
VPVQADSLFGAVVAALAEQIQRSHSCKGTYFMEDRSSATPKEALNDTEWGRAQVLENAEAKTLSKGRIDAIKDCVRARNLNPLGAAIGE